MWLLGYKNWPGLGPRELSKHWKLLKKEMFSLQKKSQEEENTGGCLRKKCFPYKRNHRRKKALEVA